MPKADRDPSQWISKELFAAYCGADDRRMQDYYERACAKRTLVFMRFHWLPVLLLPFWLGYRQQWLLWSVLVGSVALVLPWVELHAGVRLPASGLTGTWLAIGMMGEGLLLSTANQRFQRLKAQGESPEQIERLLTDRAKRSLEMGLAGGLGALALGIVGAQLIQILWAHPVTR